MVVWDEGCIQSSLVGAVQKDTLSFLAVTSICLGCFLLWKALIINISSRAETPACDSFYLRAYRKSLLQATRLQERSGHVTVSWASLRLSVKENNLCSKVRFSVCSLKYAWLKCQRYK